MISASIFFTILSGGIGLGVIIGFDLGARIAFRESTRNFRSFAREARNMEEAK